MTIRCGYPTKRVIPDKGPVCKKQMYGRHLKRYMSNARGKFFVLHATKGWKVI